MYRAFFKRLLDCIICIIGTIVFLPIMIFVFILLLISNRGYPFFFQERPGKEGKIFKVYKFRTMNNRKDSDGNLLPDEKRLTRMGVFIRKTSIDELLQIFNVLKGEMSIIGPRPLLPEYLDLYSEEQKKRHNVKPGITGWAQVNGRNTISWEKKFEYDVWYVNNISFKLDFKIFFMTVGKVIKSADINEQNQATTTKFKGNE